MLIGPSDIIIGSNLPDGGMCGLRAYGTWYWVDLLKFDALLSLGMVLGVSFANLIALRRSELMPGRLGISLQELGGHSTRRLVVILLHMV